MRLYVPATSDDLHAVQVTPTRAVLALEPRAAHAVTVAHRAALADEDDEGVEYDAWLAAADDSLGLVLASPTAAPLRVVITVEVPDDAVADEPGESGPGDEVDVEEAPSAVQVVRAVDAQVVCVHVDEPEAGPDVLAVGQVAEAELDDALQVVVDRDLLWYDWSEVAAIPTGESTED